MRHASVRLWRRRLRHAGTVTGYWTPGAELSGYYGGASTIRVKLQIAMPKVPKLVELCRFRPVDFRSSFGTVLQGVRGILILSRDCRGARAKSTHLARTPEVEHEMVGLLRVV